MNLMILQTVMRVEFIKRSIVFFLLNHENRFCVIHTHCKLGCFCQIHKRNLIFWSQKWILDVLYSSLCLGGVKFCVWVNPWQTCMNNFCTLVFGCQDIKQLQNLRYFSLTCALPEFKLELNKIGFVIIWWCSLLVIWVSFSNGGWRNVSRGVVKWSTSLH